MTPIDAGGTAPAFAELFSDADGAMHDLSAAMQRGPVLIGIYKASCQASKTLFPILERIHQRYRDRGLSVFGVSQDSPNVTRSFARRYGVTFPLLIEGDDYPISRRFDIFATPTVYLIRPDGVVVSTIMGFFREQVIEFANGVDAELGQPAEPIIGDDETDIPMFIPG